MEDVQKDTELDSLDNSSVVEETKVNNGETSDGGNTKTEEEPRVPLSRLKEEAAKRRELERRISELESKVTYETRNTSDESDPELEAALSKLEPLLKKRGFLTREEQAQEENSKRYATEMETLAKELDGSDGRPPFDAYEVSEYGKKNNIFNLRAAYNDMYRKELIDWELKKTDKVEREDNLKPVSGAHKESSKPLSITRELLAEKLRTKEGREWYNKNHDKIIAAMQKGQIL